MSRNQLSSDHLCVTYNISNRITVFQPLGFVTRRWMAICSNIDSQKHLHIEVSSMINLDVQ